MFELCRFGINKSGYFMRNMTEFSLVEEVWLMLKGFPLMDPFIDGLGECVIRREFVTDGVGSTGFKDGVGRLQERNGLIFIFWLGDEHVRYFYNSNA